MRLSPAHKRIAYRNGARLVIGAQLGSQFFDQTLELRDQHGAIIPSVLRRAQHSLSERGSAACIDLLREYQDSRCVAQSRKHA
jgi:hypothetical protein